MQRERGIIPFKVDPASNRPQVDSHGNPVLDYGLGCAQHAPSLLSHGNAGPWHHGTAGELHVGDGGKRHRLQYRLHLRYLPVLHKTESQRPALPRGGAAVTVAGIALSIIAAYAASQFNNIMDVLQLVFAFVNAPLFATFLWVCSGSARPPWRICRTVRRDCGGRGAPRSHASEWSRTGIKGDGWVFLHLYPSENGAELLDRHLRLDYVALFSRF